MPGAIQATGFEQVSAALRGLVERHRSGNLPLNAEGRRAALDRYGGGRPLADIDERFRALLPG